jgi:RHS repeat-associated protein
MLLLASLSAVPNAHAQAIDGSGRCTPNGWGGPTQCITVEPGQWEYLDQGGPYGYTTNSWYNSLGELSSALSSVYLQHGFCYANPDSAFNVNWQGFQAGILDEQDGGIPIHVGSGPQCGNVDGGIGVIQRRFVGCPGSNWSLVMTGSTAVCACNSISCMFFPRQDANGNICKGNPCNLITGNKLQREIDYTGSGAFALSFQRNYNSGNITPPLSNNFPLGRGWSATYLQYLTYTSGSPGAYAVRPDGSIVLFDTTATGFSYRGEIKDRLQWVDQSGSHVGFNYITANEDRERYDLNGRLLSITSRAGIVQTLNYNSLGRLATVVDSFGHTLSFEWDSAAKPRLHKVTDPASGVITYTYDANNNLSTVTYQDGKQRQYLYELTGSGQLNLLTGINDEDASRYVTWTYGTNNSVTSSKHAGNVDQYTFVYNIDGSRTVTDPYLATQTYATSLVAGQTRYTSSSSPCAGCSQYASVTYDASGNNSVTRDFNGVETHYTYDTARTLLTSRTEAYGTPRARTTSTQWHSTYRIPTEIDEPGRTTTFTYDTAGNPLTRTITDAATSATRTWTYTYNSFGQMLTADGPRTDVSDVTTYTYYQCSTGNECGQLHTVSDALSHVTTYNTYNAHGQPLTITDPNGVVTTLAYDSRQRLTSRTVGTEQTTFDYWPTGNLKKVTLPDSSYLQYTYDAAHRLTGVADGEGNHITYTLDAMGNRTHEDTYDPSNTLAFTHGHVFNNLGRLTQDVGAASQTTSYFYDPNGNVDTVTDPMNRLVDNDYDELNRLTRVTDPQQSVTQYAYDANDNLSSVTDPRNLTTSYTYNGFGDIKQLTSPDTGVTQYVPDTAGNVDLATDARSKSADYAYDALNRVTSITYSDQTISFAYDQGTNGVGRLTQVTDGSGTTQWTYDALGRVATKQQTVGSVVKTVGYAMNAAGQLSQMTTPSGQLIGYGYTNNKITSITVDGSALIGSVLYAPFGGTRGWTWSNSTLTVREYDQDGQLTTVDSAGLSTYQFNPDGTIKSRTDDVPVSYSLPVGATSLSVSSSSNRVTGSIGLLARTYSYDAAGNTSGDGGRSFTYNDAGRMTSSTVGSLTTTYLLSGLGQRVKKSNSSATRYFVYDEDGHLTGEYDSSGALVQEIVWLGDIPVATLRPKSGGGIDVFYIHTDQLNTPRKITRPSDNMIVWRWDSDPFGAALANDNPSALGAFEFNLRFAGQYFDSEAGLNYNYFRDGYDPATGRYTQSDPIGLGGGINAYAYADGNPISNADFFGLQAMPESAPSPRMTPSPPMRSFPQSPPANRPSPSALGALLDACAANPLVCAAVACAIPRSTSACDTTIRDPEKNCPDDDDQCATAIAKAERLYRELTTSSIPQYMYNATQGRADAGHYQAIVQGQAALRNAIDAVRRHCRNLPPDLSKWESLANQTFPVRH